MSTPRRSLLKSAAAVGGAALGVSAAAATATPAAAADIDTTPGYPSSTTKDFPDPVSGTVPLSLKEAGTFTCTLKGDVIFQFTDWPAGGVAVEPTVIATQDSAGQHTITYEHVTWLPDGSVPVFQLGAGAVNINSFFSDDNGTTVYGQGGTSQGGGFGVYGDGNDGLVDLDGTKTYPFLGKSSTGPYYWLMRDVYPSQLFVRPGVTLQLGGGGTATFRLFCSGLVTIAATGRIVTYINTNSSGSTGGSNLTTGTLLPGVAGPGGTTGAGTAGTGVLGEDGKAGAGGSAKSGATAGGAGGVSALTTAVKSLPRALPWAAMMASVTPSGTTFIPGGASGGAGAGDGSKTGGAGGVGGNPLFMAAHSIVNNGSITANGGTGGDATTDSNAGGGGGGQGGPIMLIHSGYSGSGGTISSAGGPGGKGSGTGAAGAAGGPSWIIELVN